jgi:SAM-dependent MidA family methyltransferase
MKRLEEKIAEKIRLHGPVSFAEFMELALYDPQYGYYTSAGTRIGRKGDFFTSAHMHAAFGAMLAGQALEMWAAIGRPDPFYVVECGPGTGLLCADFLDALKNSPSPDGALFYAALRYRLVEISPALKRLQEEFLLPAYAQKIAWAGTLSELKDDGAVRGCVLSNELLDAFPVHLVQTRADGDDVVLMEVFVDSTPDGFTETLKPSGPALVKYMEEFFTPKLPPGYRTEINLAARVWLADAAALLDEGFVLTVDYGYAAWEYYAPERNRGTLMCYRRHTLSEDPYADPGAQDITAHVNFSALKKWGDDLGLRTLGYCTQGVFLVSMGIGEALAGIGVEDDYLRQAAQIKRLIMPGALGESHKVMAQYKGSGEPRITPGAEQTLTRGLATPLRGLATPPRGLATPLRGFTTPLRGFSMSNRVGRL